MHSTFEDNRFDAAVRCLSLLAVVLVAGTIGFLITEDWTLWECLYFTLITITTVGYGDQGVSEMGERVAAMLLFCGIGTFTYSLSTLVQVAMDEETSRKAKTKKILSRCSDHIIVCGYGRMGQTIYRQLETGGLQCVVIEHNDKQYHDALDDGIVEVHGVASDDDVLLAAGIKRARGIVCAVDSDAENMYVTVTARELNPRCLIVSRAEACGAARKLKQAGVDLVVSPHQMAGESAANALLRPNLTRIMNGDDDECRFDFGEAVVHEKSQMVGRTICDVGHEAEGLVFVAIRHIDGKVTVRPTGRQKFESGDVVIFAGHADDSRYLLDAAGEPAGITV